MSLKQLQESLKKYVKGQDEAIQVVSTSIYKYLLKLHGRDFGCRFNGAHSLLLYGPTGSGKTFLIKTVADYFDIPFVEVNAKSIREEGWAGKSFIQLIEAGLSDLRMKTSQYHFQGGIIFIDEFDKMIIPESSSTDKNVNFHIQASLLKYIEGITPQFEKHLYFDFNKCFFVFAGSFADMMKQKKPEIGFHESDLKVKKEVFIQEVLKYGMLDELAGRIQEYCELKPITKTIYSEILDSPDFMLTLWKVVLKHGNITLNENKEELIQHALKINLGVRGLIQAIEQLVTNCLIENSDIVSLEAFSVLSSKGDTK